MHVVEIDRDIVARLATQFAPERLIVHQGDALRFDFGTLGPELRLIGNLPYNISSPMLFHAAEFGPMLRDCHFMLQREVVDRMAAAPGSKVYGRLSVMLQYRFRVEKLFEVPAGAFRPAPKVDSAFVRLTPARSRCPRRRRTSVCWQRLSRRRSASAARLCATRSRISRAQRS